MPTKSQTENYDNLSSTVGDEKLKERLVFFLQIAEAFIRDRGAEDFIYIDKEAVRSIVTDYFSDIIRLKDFHGIERVEFTKVAAYTAYWTYKRKPLNYIKRPDPEIYQSKPYLKDINEWFCAHILIAMVYDSRQYLFRDADSLNKYNAFKTCLNYFLTYRVVTAQALELVLMALDVSPPHPTL